MKRISRKFINHKRKSSKDIPVAPPEKEDQEEYGDILSLSGSIDATPEELAKMLMGVSPKSIKAK